MNEIAFEVGHTYENEKGVYEVVSLDKTSDKMVIKWEDGKEFTTSIDLQRRIQERRKIESEWAKTGGGPNGRQGRSPRAAHFEGFSEKDFSGKVAGTTWRTQKSLGGVVTTLVNAHDTQVKSRAVSRMPEVHWVDHHPVGGDQKNLPAKLFVKLEPEALKYGLLVSCKDIIKQDSDNANTLFDWLSDDKNDSWLKEIADEYDLRICDMKKRGRSFEGVIELKGNTWQLGDGTDHKPVDSLAGFLQGIKETEKIDLYVAKAKEKEEVLGRGANIAEDIAGLFDILMPLYKACNGSGG